MKNVIILSSLLGLSACATMKVEPKVSCQTQPQWFANDEQGRPKTAIYICFAPNGNLVYRNRALTVDEIIKMSAPKPAAAATVPVPTKKTK